MVMRARRPRRGAHVFGSGPGVHHGVLLPVFFSGDRLEKTVIAESGVPLSLVLKNECTVPLELYLTAEEAKVK